jgi:hypothetical protein
MRYLKPLLLISSLLTLLLLTSCKPAATPMPTPTLLLSPSPVSAQQVAPTATREVTPSPVATPTIPAAAAKSGIRITAKIGPSCPGPARSSVRKALSGRVQHHHQPKHGGDTGDHRSGRPGYGRAAAGPVHGNAQNRRAFSNRRARGCDRSNRSDR